MPLVRQSPPVIARPTLWLQASTATIYAHTFGPAHDERNGVIGGAEVAVPDTWRFSVDVAKSWEAAVDEFSLPQTRGVNQTRVVKLRSSIVLSPDRDGIFDVLMGLVRRGLGGTNGSGRQFVSWIHELDFVAALRWIIERKEIEGVVNVASPNPLPNREFMAELRGAAGVSLGLPAPAWMLELGALFMGTESELILKSRRVAPGEIARIWIRVSVSELARSR